MDPAHVLELVDKLSEDISDLKDALEPFTRANLNDTANKLPVLDRAKFFTLAAYSIESILFSNLRLTGVDARSHPVFTELARVRQYFDKIRAAETGEQRPRLRLNKDAVERIIKHELSSNKNQGTKRKFDEKGVPHVVKNDSDAVGQAGEGEKARSDREQAGAEPKAEISITSEPKKDDPTLSADVVMLSDAEQKSSKKKKAKKDKKDRKSKESKKDKTKKEDKKEEKDTEEKKDKKDKKKRKKKQGESNEG